MTYRRLLNPELFSRDQIKPAKNFSGCFFISCKQSKERRRVFLKAAKAEGLDPVWVKGVEPSFEDLQNMGFENVKQRQRLKGNVGCTASHFQIISEARRLKLQSVLIFEDDAAFCPDWSSELEAATASLSSLPWEILYLGGVPKQTTHKNIAPGLWRAEGVWSTLALAVHSRFFEYFLSYQDRRPISVIDCFLFHQAPDRLFLLTQKPLNWPREVQSVTAGKVQKGSKERAEKIYNQNLQQQPN